MSIVLKLKKLKVLTTDSCRVGESLIDVRVHLNEQVLGRRHRVVSLLDLPRDPVSEWLANYGGSHVAYPLFWKTPDLLMFLGEVLEAYWVTIEKRQDIFD